MSYYYEQIFCREVRLSFVEIISATIIWIVLDTVNMVMGYYIYESGLMQQFTGVVLRVESLANNGLSSAIYHF